jgi:hypothetical protein
MSQSVIAALDAALRAADAALAGGMRTASGASASPQLEQLRAGLLAMRGRGSVDAGELRTMIRAVAEWAPEQDVTLLSALGAVARAT